MNCSSKKARSKCQCHFGQISFPIWRKGIRFNQYIIIYIIKYIYIIIYWIIYVVHRIISKSSLTKMTLTFWQAAWSCQWKNRTQNKFSCQKCLLMSPEMPIFATSTKGEWAHPAAAAREASASCKCGFGMMQWDPIFYERRQASRRPTGQVRLQESRP